MVARRRGVQLLSRRDVSLSSSRIATGSPVSAPRQLSMNSLKQGRFHSTWGVAALCVNDPIAYIGVPSEAPIIAWREPSTILATSAAVPPVEMSTADRIASIKKKARRILRIFARTMKIVAVLSPMAVLYPIWCLQHRLLGGPSQETKKEDDSYSTLEEHNLYNDWYMSLSLYSIEASGAAFIKLMQDDTTPHQWRYTEEILKASYGENWQEHFQIGRLLGSGCIGQVYEGIIDGDDGKMEKVAVKVRHPRVVEDIETDMEILRCLADWSKFIPGHLGDQIRWLDPMGAVEGFAKILTGQLDFRSEAINLDRFNKNFANDEDVIFPKLVPGYEAHPDVLVETFCEGIPVAKWAKKNAGNQEKLSSMCKIGDLHPGNVWISEEGKFILLDVGMVTEYDDDDHEVIINVLTAFIRKNGREAGRLMVNDSNRRMLKDNEAALNEEAYIDKIEALTDRANNNSDYLVEAMGSYVAYICDAAAVHHVMMNQAFLSACLAVKVQEGIALGT
eukprot:scaffold73616_cov49-Attheya_sp.AAC.2